MDDLRAELVEHGLHVLLEAVQDPFDDASSRRIVDVADEVTQPRGVLEVPEKGMSRRGMEESPQGSAEVRRTDSEVANGLQRQVLGLHLGPGHERDDPDDV